MKARRRATVFSLSFLDAMTCGFGAVVLFFMIINAAVDQRADDLTRTLRSEADLLDAQVLNEQRDLLELRDALRSTEDERNSTRGYMQRLIEEIQRITAELAELENSTTAKAEHINRLKSSLKNLEEETRRLAAETPSEVPGGDQVRRFVGQGDRQYLTGLKVGGRRIFILVDASASMLGETVVNVIRRRNLPDQEKVRAEKWQRVLEAVDWLSTQLPQESQFQIHTFNTQAVPVIEDSEGAWLDAGDVDVLNRSIRKLRDVVPAGGTSLHNAIAAVNAMNPKPDNVVLLIDSLPTQGKTAPIRKTVSSDARLKHFNRAVRELPAKVPVNVILFPMEGDPLAASSYWKLAYHTGGAFLSPSRDWP